MKSRSRVTPRGVFFASQQPFFSRSSPLHLGHNDSRVPPMEEYGTSFLAPGRSSFKSDSSSIIIGKDARSFSNSFKVEVLRLRSITTWDASPWFVAAALKDSISFIMISVFILSSDAVKVPSNAPAKEPLKKSAPS